MNYQDVLSLKMRANDAEANTLREYLVALLLALWTEGEEFSAKRPFGNSGWQWDVYECLVAGGVVKGIIDEDGIFEGFESTEDEVDAERYVELHLIPALTPK